MPVSTAPIPLRQMLPFMQEPQLEEMYFNPHWPLAHEHTIKRAQQLGLIKTERDVKVYNASKFTELCAVWFPLATFEILCVVTDYYYFLYLIIPAFLNML
jgi:hypothetical protein